MSHLGQEDGQLMVDTPSRVDPGIETTGALFSQNPSDIPSRKECEKEGMDNPVHDEGDDAIASHQKSISNLGQEKVQTMVDTPSRAAPGLKTIGASFSKNTYNTSFRKECENYGAE